MKNEFIPYEEALALKELGFDEPCFGLYALPSKTVFLHHYGLLSAKEQILTPTFSQVFRWFRKKFDFCPCITPSSEKITIKYEYGIFENGELNLKKIKGNFNSFEEAELACLKELIEIIKVSL